MNVIIASGFVVAVLGLILVRLDFAELWGLYLTVAGVAAATTTALLDPAMRG